MKPHHKSNVWKKSKNFVKHIYELTSKLPDAEKFGLTSQMRRAAISAKMTPHALKLYHLSLVTIHLSPTS
jgi:hypothetical protein